MLINGNGMFNGGEYGLNGKNHTYQS